MQLMGSYAVSLKSKPDNPAHSVVYDNPVRAKYALKPSSSQPFGIRMTSYFEDLGVLELPVKYNHQTYVPPWTVVNIKVDLSLSQFLKSDSPDIFFRQSLQEKINYHSPCDVIYTDGSKSDAGTGCAFVTTAREYKFHIPTVSSIYTAELFAILKALNILCPLTRKLVICSDSLSSLMAIGDMFSRHVLVREILSAAHSLGQRGIQVVLMWSPGHVGIVGNELADKAAKEATGLPLCTHAVVALDVKSLIKKLLRNTINEEWQTVVNNKLRGIKSDVAPWVTACRTDRREEVVLCRLRIGHTTLTHGFLMNRGDPPMCGACDVPLSVKHIIIECQKYTRERQVHRLPSTLSEALGDDERKVLAVFKFLDSVQLFSKF